MSLPVADAVRTKQGIVVRMKIGWPPGTYTTRRYVSTLCDEDAKKLRDDLTFALESRAERER